MAYSVTLPPAQLVQRIGGQSAIWGYRSVDDAATVRGSGYFTNGVDLGMKLGDVVFHNDTDAGPPPTTSVSTVSAINATTGAVTVAALT